ncbi:hypothetical protein C4573_04900 [Candidatus Woesearchaeota archaeon]|nr:MAG: hypothetical protein C4573_04900 [Candidatus Woesearchaeota archaeon]
MVNVSPYNEQERDASRIKIKDRRASSQMDEEPAKQSRIEQPIQQTQQPSEEQVEEQLKESMRERFARYGNYTKKGMKATGKGLWKGTKAMGRGTLATAAVGATVGAVGYQMGKGAVQKTAQGIGGTASWLKNQGTNNAYKWFFWLTLIWHLIDAFGYGFQRTGALYDHAYIVYLIFAILAWFFVFRQPGNFGGAWHIFGYFAISAASIFIPLLRTVIPTGDAFGGLSYGDLFNLFLVLVPAWPVYTAKHFDYFFGTIKAIWVVILVSFLVVGFIDFGQITAAGPDGNVMSPLQKVWSVIKEAAKRMMNVALGIPGNVTYQIRVAADPYYAAEVEKNKGVQLGVTFGEIEPYYTYFEYGDPIGGYITVTGRTFVDEAKVTNKCFLDDYEGLVDPAGFGISELETYYLQCNIGPALGPTTIDFTKQSHQFTFKSTFNFQTWGYVTYTFMDRDLLRNLRSENKDPVSLYQIARYPEAVYTNGPVKLGLVDIRNPPEQPMAVSKENPILPVFGITIQNSDPLGKVVKINQLTFRIPKPLQLDLTTCNTKDPKNLQNVHVAEDGKYTNYTFVDIPANVNSEYLTVRCRLKMENTSDTFIIQKTPTFCITPEEPIVPCKTSQCVMGIANYYYEKYGPTGEDTCYQYGGESPEEGFDCSGWTYWVMSHAGVPGFSERLSASGYLRLARSMNAKLICGDKQITPSSPDCSLTEINANAKPGDIVFTNPQGDGVGHVALYTGNGMIMESVTGQGLKKGPIPSHYLPGGSKPIHSIYRFSYNPSGVEVFDKNAFLNEYYSCAVSEYVLNPENKTAYADDLLGDGGISVNTFIVIASYDYELSKTKSVQIGAPR